MNNSWDSFFNQEENKNSDNDKSSDNNTNSDNEEDEYDIYRCPLCYQEFDDEYDLMNHHTMIHEHNFFFSSSLSLFSSNYTQHPCPLCDRRFYSTIQLNEHFALIHLTNYNQLCEMDTKKVHDGFPSFEILEEIMMIAPVNKSFDFNQDCLVCCCRFKKDNIKILDSEYIDGYCSDSETYCRKTKKIKRPFCKKINKLHHKISLMDTRPVVMTCCDAVVCRRCLQLMINNADNLVCMFCKHDHEKRNSKYITIIEETDKCDPAKWRSWWWRNINLLI